MIKHMIMIKLNDNSEEKIKEVKDKLLSMDGKVPMISGLEVLADFLHSDRSYDVFLSAVVADEKALDDYQNDPYHCEIKAYIKTVAKSVIALDAVM